MNFKVLRGGTHTTFQDNGFLNKQHLGITTGGIVDYELFVLANKILNNKLDSSILEFSYQGPSLMLMSGKTRIVISGNVFFKIITSKKILKGIPYKSYLLNEGDIIDVISTINSNYGYLAVDGGFNIIKQFGSSSTLTISKIGLNNGEKIKDNQVIEINRNFSNYFSTLNYINDDSSNCIRVIEGPQMHYFFPKIIKNFFSKSFTISNNSNRMGIRLNGNICKPTISSNITSEPIIKGSIQVPGDGNPIILINDHPTIGGYPKIAIVALADLSKIAQSPTGSSVNFKKISLKEAEILYKKKITKINSLIDSIVVKKFKI